MSGAELIADERQRQIEAEGFTVEHDDKWTDHEMVYAAFYFMNIDLPMTDDLDSAIYYSWPWNWAESWRKDSRNNIRNLVRAGALIAAEIDRLQRLEDKV